MKKKLVKKVKKVEKKKEKKAPVVATKRVKIKIVGIGGGGGNIVKELSKKLGGFSSSKIDFIAINTDIQALSSLPRKLKTLAIGQAQTAGMGTGRDVSLGEKIAMEEGEKIKKTLFTDDKDLYIFISSLGGGTGTGATPVISKMAKSLGMTTLGIFTLPFNFEGREKMKQAHRALDLIKENFNATLVLPNEKIFKIVEEDVSFNNALNLLNDQLANALEGLLSTVYSSGLINIDWADIKTTLEGSKKIAYLNTTKTKASQELDEFAKALLENKLLDYNFGNSTNVLFNIEGGKNLSMQQLAKISEHIHSLAPNAKIIFGLCQNNKLKNEIRATVLATGAVKEKVEKPKPKKKKPKKKEEIKKEEIKQPEKKEKLKKEKKLIRRNALEVKAVKEKEREKEEEDENILEVPAFLRNKNKQ